MILRQLKDLITVSDILNMGNELTVVQLMTIFIDDSEETTPVLDPKLEEIFVNNADEIIVDYYISRMDKFLSVTSERLRTQEGFTPEQCALGLAKIIMMKYYHKWVRLCEALYAEYNPIHNYDMTEEENGTNNKNVNTDMNVKTDSTDTRTDKYNGFNSTSPSNVTESVTDTDGDVTTTGLKSKNQENDTNKRTLTRSGNIGVTTSAQMITQELVLRQKTFINDIVYNDIDKVLFLDYYK